MGLRRAEPYLDPAPMLSIQQWFAVQVTPRHEKNVAALMREKRLENFLPLVKELHYWSDRRKIIETPLFSGYTFVRLSPAAEDRVEVLRTPGVIRLVGKDYAGDPIPDKEIEDVSILVNSRLKIDPYPFLKIGDRVRVRSGSLAGVEGVLIDKNSDATLVVSVNLLQRSVGVRLQGFEVESLAALG